MARPTDKKADKVSKKTEEVSKKTDKEVVKKKRQKKLVRAKDDVEKKKYAVPIENIEEVSIHFDYIGECMEEAAAFIEKLVDKGKRSSAKEARAWVQEMIVTGKKLRKALQDAKLAIAPVEETEEE